METLVMPMNYVELQEDEMMYLDGGFFKWDQPWNSVENIATGINGALLIFGIWSLKGHLAKSWVTHNFDKVVGAMSKFFGVNGFMADKIRRTVAGLAGLASLSVGFLVATAIDYADGWFGGRSGNGICFG